jgi:hypothetical protein
MKKQQTIKELNEQLHSLYKEKEELQSALGVSDARDVILMVQNLEEQLCALYAERQESLNNEKESS